MEIFWDETDDYLEIKTSGCYDCTGESRWLTPEDVADLLAEQTNIISLVNMARSTLFRAVHLTSNPISPYYCSTTKRHIREAHELCLAILAERRILPK